jgi:hypothetical protein
MTAPDHFLGDYPAVKWRRFAHSIPADLTGKTVLDIGGNAGFYSIQMKLRGASRVLAIDIDPDYLRQARFAAQTIRVSIEFAEMSAYDVGCLGERLDIVPFLGFSTICAIRYWRSTSSASTSSAISLSANRCSEVIPMKSRWRRHFALQFGDAGLLGSYWRPSPPQRKELADLLRPG